MCIYILTKCTILKFFFKLIDTLIVYVNEICCGYFRIILMCPNPCYFSNIHFKANSIFFFFPSDDSIEFSVDVGKNLMGLDTEKGCFGKLEFTPKFSQGDLL